MKKQTFFLISGVIFSMVLLLHILRLILGWEAVIGGWHVPFALSWIAIPLSSGLAIVAFKLYSD